VGRYGGHVGTGRGSGGGILLPHYSRSDGCTGLHAHPCRRTVRTAPQLFLGGPSIQLNDSKCVLLLI
jgi:hypothetical protein